MKKSVVFISLIAIVSAALWIVHAFSQESSRAYESAEKQSLTEMWLNCTALNQEK